MSKIGTLIKKVFGETPSTVAAGSISGLMTEGEPFDMQPGSINYLPPVGKSILKRRFEAYTAEDTRFPSPGTGVTPPKDLDPEMTAAVQKWKDHYDPPVVTPPINESPFPSGGPSLGLGSAMRMTFTVSQYGAFSLTSDVLTQQGFSGIDDIMKAIDANAWN
jgi:hypothetical protein